MSNSSDGPPPPAGIVTDARTEAPSAVVIGAGIAGLTVAHELADRRWKVTVVERATGLDADRVPGMRVGGMAGSQYQTPRPFPGRTGPDSSDFVVPGEHGFRFFPSYYHHIWDTMQRIPLYDAAGRPTARRVYDNIEPCLSQGWAGGEDGPVVFSRRPIHGVAELVWMVRQALGLRVTGADLEAATLRLLRYMCTSSRRRGEECEDISVWSYFMGNTGPHDPPRFQYSPQFADSLEMMPVVLAAFNAQWGDARTNLDHLIQLMRPLIRSQPKVDGVLNGPTSSAWLDPWRRHLEVLGVTFLCGEACPLQLSEGRVLFRYKRMNADDGAVEPGDPVRLEADYYIVATDAPAAEALSADLPRVGVPGSLHGYTTSVPPNPYDGSGGCASRDPHAQVGLAEWDRFQTLTGIQFYFDVDISLMRGHLYFMGSEWGITAIAQQPFWRVRPSTNFDHFRSVLSVDIGDWLACSDHADSVVKKAASQCTPDELAREVWSQITRSLAKGYEGEIPTPLYYVVDENIVYDPERQTPCKNMAPYFIPMVKDFHNRPGGDPWNPTRAKVAMLELKPPRTTGLWQAGHGGQIVHWDQLVYAGTYLKTFTRLTTMEAACESGRHAVNALIDHLLYLRSGRKDNRGWNGVHWEAPPSHVDDRNGTPISQPSPIGDYCVIWDIEENELPELQLARDIDEQLLRAGLPHPWELFGLDNLTEITSWLNRLTPAPAADPPPDPAAALRASALQGLQALAKLTRLQNELLAKVLRPKG